MSSPGPSRLGSGGSGTETRRHPIVKLTGDAMLEALKTDHYTCPCCGELRPLFDESTGSGVTTINIDEGSIEIKPPEVLSGLCEEGMKEEVKQYLGEEKVRNVNEEKAEPTIPHIMMSLRRQGLFGVPYGGHKKPLNIFESKLIKEVDPVKLIATAKVMEALDELKSSLKALSFDPAGPSPAISRAFNSWREIHPEAAKRRKGQHWTQRWISEIDQEMKNFKEKGSDAQDTAHIQHLGEQEACDCGHYPYCSSVCDRRLNEKEHCTCRSWPLCEVNCNLWQMNLHIANAAWKLKADEMKIKKMMITSPEKGLQRIHDAKLARECGHILKDIKAIRRPGFWKKGWSTNPKGGEHPNNDKNRETKGDGTATKVKDEETCEEGEARGGEDTEGCERDTIAEGKGKERAT